MTSAVDNDVLYKGAWFGILRELIAAVPTTHPEALVLGQVRFVIGKKIEKQRREHGAKAEAALAHFNEVLAELAVIEPTDEETALAAEFEALAQQEGVALDGGESLLCAIVFRRKLERLATGDKRAVLALAALMPKRDELGSLRDKIVCLEQLVLRTIRNGSNVRKAICDGRHVDKALANCFSCTNPEERPQDWIDGLQSYINHLRANTPGLLASDS